MYRIELGTTNGFIQVSHRHNLLPTKIKMAAAATLNFTQNATTKPPIEVHTWHFVLVYRWPKL